MVCWSQMATKQETKIKQRQRSFVEKLSRFRDVTKYYDIQERRDFFHAKLLRKKTELLNFIVSANPTHTVLDVGSAEGINLKILSEKEECFRVALDIARNPLRKLKKRMSNVDAVQGDAENLPFRDRSIDVCIASELLEHLPNPERCFRELTRVTQGYVMVTTPRRSFLRVIMDRLCDAVSGRKEEHPSEVTCQDITHWSHAVRARIVLSFFDCYVPTEVVATFRLNWQLIEKLNNIIRGIPVISTEFSILQLFLIRALA